MSSFWKTSTGEEASGDVKETNNSFDPLPPGWYTCMLEDVSIDEYQGQRKISIQARVVQEKYKNRVVFLKLKAFKFEGKDYKVSTHDNAIQKLVKMYKICKVPLPRDEPDDRDLSLLADKPIDLMLDIWESDTNDNRGNWLVNVEASGVKAGKEEEPEATKARSARPQSSAKPVARKAASAQSFDDYDDDIPF